MEAYIIRLLNLNDLLWELGIRVKTCFITLRDDNWLDKPFLKNSSVSIDTLIRNNTTMLQQQQKWGRELSQGAAQTR
jgi:hypothetical protein